MANDRAAAVAVVKHQWYDSDMKANALADVESGMPETTIQLPAVKVKVFREFRRRIPMRGVVFQEHADQIDGMSCQDQIHEFAENSPVLLLSSKMDYVQSLNPRDSFSMLACTVRYVDISDLVMAHFGR